MCERVGKGVREGRKGCSMTRLMLTSAITDTIAITQERKGRKG